MTPLRPGSPTDSGLALSRASSGVVAGYLFKIIREQLPCTQEGLAELLNVDKATVQGWESGRRPLASTKSGNLLAIRRRLLRAGSSSELLALLDSAMEADRVLEEGLTAGARVSSVDEHPLADWVFTRDLTHLLAWALTGAAPSAITAHATTTKVRRGPSATSPLLGQPDRARFFAHLRRVAELADHVGDSAALVRRQACYLSSYDRSDDAREWLDSIHRRYRRSGPPGWSLLWPDARSVATSLARQGDRQPLLDFIEHGLGDDSGDVANLNYWAYWTGVDTRPQTSDTFMASRPLTAWDATRLLRQFTERLDPALGYIDLYVHSVWALLVSRPGVLQADPLLAVTLRAQVSALLDGDVISSQSRRELQSIHYGLRLHGNQ